MSTPLKDLAVLGIKEPTTVTIPNGAKTITFQITPEIITAIQHEMSNLGFTNEKLSKAPIPNPNIVKYIKELLIAAPNKIGSIHDQTAVAAYVALTEKTAGEMGYWNNDMLIELGH